MHVVAAIAWPTEDPKPKTLNPNPPVNQKAGLHRPGRSQASPAKQESNREGMYAGMYVCMYERISMHVDTYQI